MKNYIKFGMIAALSAWVAGSTNAQEVTWVQSANFTLTAQVQVSDTAVQKFAINSKTIIQYLKGATNVGTVSVPTAETNGTARVTNSTFLPNPGAPLAAFPQDFLLTNNYFVTIGATRYTNNIHFTHDYEMIETSDAPVTYEFPNVLTLDPTVTGFDTNADAVLFTVLPDSTGIIAVQDTAVTNATVFTLFGTATTFSDVQVTNTVPEDFDTKTQRLIVKSSPDSQDFSWFIRDGTAKNFVDYDVSTFFVFNHLAEVSQQKGNGFSDFVDLSIDFDNRNGTAFGTEANGKQTRTPVARQTGLFVKGPTATCVGSGQAGTPIVAPLTGRPLPTGSMVLSGKFSASGGKIEAVTSAQ